YERKLELSGKAAVSNAPKRTKRSTAKRSEPPARAFDPEADYTVGERVDAGERGVGVVSEIASTFIAVKFRTSGELRWQRVPPNAIEYAIKRRFAVGDCVKHPTFGAGIVRAATRDRVEIDFWSEGTKTLVHAKQ